MKIVVLGGTGTLGRHVVREAAGRGHVVRAVSRHAPARLPEGARHVALDVAALGTTAEGTALPAAVRTAADAALTGADAVIDTVGGGRRVLVDGVHRLLAEEEARGVGRHIMISIVGCDRVPMSYYRVKVAQEEAVASGPVPWSILRATQFHELVARLAHAAAAVGLRPSGGIPLQPVDPAAVAPFLVDAVEQQAGGRLADVGGPRVQSLGELCTQWGRSAGKRRLAARVPLPGKIGRAVRARGLCLDAAGRPAGDDFATWLAAAGTD